MANSRYFESGYSYISPYVDRVLPPLTMIAQAIYDSTTVTHFRQGLQQFYRGFSLWEEATETRDILAQSLYSNTVEYLLPVIMYRRLMTVLTEEYSPDATDALLNVLDNTILLLFFIRLYQRRLADNIFNSISLTRAISNDVTEHLLELASEGFSGNITRLLLKLLDMDTLALTMLKDDIQLKLSLKVLPESFETVYNGLSADKMLQAYIKVSFRIELEKFFAKPKITAETFAEIIEPLQLIIVDKITKYFVSVPDQARVNNFSRLTATIIANQMASVFSSVYKNKLAQDKTELTELLSQSVFISVAKKQVEDYLRAVENTSEKIKLFLPVKTDPICDCEFKKLLHGGISSQVYYAANQFYTTIPTLLLKSGHLSLDTYSYLDIPMQMVAIWLYGQCFNESKVTTDASCTRHRYLEFSRNKVHSFGLGLAYYLTLHTLIRAVYLTTEVDNFFTRDALSNLLMQFATVSMLIHNDRLPGKKDFPWDWFYWPREATRKVVNTLQYLFERHPDDKEKRNNVLINIQSTLMSTYFSYGTDLIFSGSDLLPRAALLEFNKGQSFLPEAQDPRRVLLDIPSFNRLIRLYRKDIETVIETLKEVHEGSKWVPKWIVNWMSNPFLPLPAILALIVDMLQLMKDENWEDLIKNHELELFLAFYHKPLEVNETIVHAVTEESDQIVLSDKPVALSHFVESHIKPTEVKENKIKPRISVVHTDIVSFDFSKPEMITRVVEPTTPEKNKIIELKADDFEIPTSSGDNRFEPILPDDITLTQTRSEPITNAMASMVIDDNYLNTTSAPPASTNVAKLAQRRRFGVGNTFLNCGKLPMINTVNQYSMWGATYLAQQAQAAIDAVSATIPASLNSIPSKEVELRSHKRM